MQRNLLPILFPSLLARYRHRLSQTTNTTPRIPCLTFLLPLRIPDTSGETPQPPPPVEPKTEPSDRQQPPLLNTDPAIKKLPQRKSHSIFTPIEENRSILSQHLASFAAEPQAAKGESGQPAGVNRSQSADPGPHAMELLHRLS